MQASEVPRIAVIRVRSDMLSRVVTITQGISLMRKLLAAASITLLLNTLLPAAHATTFNTAAAATHGHWQSLTLSLGEERHYVGVLRDITQRKRDEAAILLRAWFVVAVLGPVAVVGIGSCGPAAGWWKARCRSSWRRMCSWWPGPSSFL